MSEEINGKTRHQLLSACRKGSREEQKCERGPAYFTVRVNACGVLATLSLSTSTCDSCLTAVKEQFLPYQSTGALSLLRTPQPQWLPIQRAM